MHPRNTTITRTGLETASIEWTALSNQIGDIQIIVEISDGANDTLITEAIFVENVSNDPPVDISIAETEGIFAPISAGGVIATLVEDDLDGPSATFQLVTGAGDSDNSKVTITGNQLKSNQSVEFETQLSIRVQVSNGFETYAEAMTILIQNQDSDGDYVADFEDFDPYDLLFFQ